MEKNAVLSTMKFHGLIVHGTREVLRMLEHGWVALSEFPDESFFDARTLVFDRQHNPEHVLVVYRHAESQRFFCVEIDRGSTDFVNSKIVQLGVEYQPGSGGATFEVFVVKKEVAALFWDWYRFKSGASELPKILEGTGLIFLQEIALKIQRRFQKGPEDSIWSYFFVKLLFGGS